MKLPEGCVLNMFPAAMPFNVIGVPLFLGTYSVHDPVTGVIDFYPHSTSNKMQPVEGSWPAGQFLKWKIYGGRPIFTTILYYIFNMSVCAGMIYAWRNSLYNTLKESYTNDEVKAYSVAYFLGSAFVFYSIVNLFDAGRYKGTAPGKGGLEQTSLEEWLTQANMLAIVGLAMIAYTVNAARNGKKK